MLDFAVISKTMHARHKGVCGDDAPHSSPCTLKGVSVNRDTREVKGVIAADVMDMDREVFIPSGIVFGEKAYFPGSTKAVYLDHAWMDAGVSAYDRLPIGVCRSIELQGDAIFARTIIAKRTIGDELLTLIELEAVRGMSIGAKVLDDRAPVSEDRMKYGQGVSRIVTKSMLLEYSLLSMQSNPDAVLKCLRGGTIRRTTAALFNPDVTPERVFYPVTGPAKVSRKTIILGERMDVQAVIG